MFKLLRNCSVYAPEDLGVRDLLVVGERIAWIAPPGQAPPGTVPCEEIDVGGRMVIPALVDSHVHITGGGGEAGYGTRIPPLPPSAFTSAGIGTVVGLLGTDDTTRDTGGLVAWARELDAAGLSAFCHTGGYHLPLATLTGSVRSDIAWIDTIIGVGELAISDHRSSQPSVQELLRVAADAHVGGLMTGKAGILHLHVGDGPGGLAPIRAALAAGDVPPRVFNPTHVNRRKALFEEATALAKSGCHVDLTAFPVADGEDRLPAEDALLRYLESDAPADKVTVSSDGGGCLPCFNDDGQPVGFGVARPAALFECLARLLAAGHAPEVVLPPFTSTAANLLRLPDKGRITIGACADVVVLGEEHEVSEVMIRGRWHVRDGGQILHGPLEERA